MPTAAVMPETHNFTDSFSGQNLTEPSGTEALDAAGCLFVSILPYGQAVPALIGLFVLFTLFSLLVNVVTFLGLARSEELSWQLRFTFLKNLILSDLMQIATFGPPVIHSLVQRRTMAFSTWCYVQYFLGAASIFNSLVTITCMALERYLYVCHAIHYLVILTETRLRRVLTLIWIDGADPDEGQAKKMKVKLQQEILCLTSAHTCDLWRNQDWRNWGPPESKSLPGG